MAGTNGATAHESVVRVCSGGDERRAARRLLDAGSDVEADIPVVEVGSTGVTGIDPLVAVTHDGTTAFHAAPSIDRFQTLVERLAEGELVEDDADAVVEHGDDRGTLPIPESGPLSVGRRRILGRCGWVDPTSAVDYGTFATESVRDDPDVADGNVRDVGLLGRGRGDGSTDLPVVDEWDVAREASGDDDPETDPVVVVNANESDERNRTDRTLLEGAPLDVLDGALAVAELVDAEDVVVYVNEADDLARERVHEAVQALGDALDVDRLPDVVVGQDRFIAGEMTMALEAMEGNDRLEARLRPPSPAEHGLYGRPTVIHTPRTFAQVRAGILDPDSFDADDADPGTRLVTVTGDVDAPATVELPTGESLAAVRDAVDFAGPLKMAMVGGQFGGLTRTLDHTPSAPSLSGSKLGTEGVVELFDDDTCVLATVGERARFAEEENCGRCVPCREGTKQLTGLLRDIYDGSYEDGMLRELARVMHETSTCDFGQSAARPVMTGLNEFETEFEAHAEGRCPSGTCREV